METPRRRPMPLDDELLSREPIAPGRPSLAARLSRKFPRRPPPTTTRGAIVQGLRRVVLMLWLATMIAFAVDRLVLPNRGGGIGFYLVGAGILSIALASANGAGHRRWTNMPGSAEPGMFVHRL